ncbi:intracellular multiplication protein IcmE [Piscirickettsia salmonis]|uniref:DotG/IcmE/VirB10 family protein n=1 Tax=Piscirickettsia salmonis TaxID=1238 RepID=UPI001E2A9B7D|nr:DotG/IcmE/VirB10 family protein [Piscirickettsia salmonis]QGP49191.1 intracellular multiplication protein IcmE [Piscirickettsia salmonis]
MKILKTVNKFFNKYPRLRVFIIFIFISVLVIIFVNSLSKPGTIKDFGQSSVRQANTKLSSKSSDYTGKVYENLNDKNNNQVVDSAEQTGKSLVIKDNKNNTTTTVNAGIKNNLDNFNGLTAEQKRIANVTGSKAYVKMIQRENLHKEYAQGNINNTNNRNLDKRLFDNEVKAQEKAMQARIRKISSSWSTVTLQQAVRGQAPKNLAESKVNTEALAKNVMIKSGSIVFAVLDTQLNSDQPGTPVMATVVQGKYKNAKLLGSFQRENDKLVIKFNQMSIATMNSSLKINAYAVNATTAQNALASDVNHHYLLRYGGLFAAAFLQGFGEYYSDTASTICGDSTTCIVTGDQSSDDDSASQTTRKAMYSGLGSVGSALSQAAADNFNRPPTVTLNQGVGMGILFMNDVTQ